MSTPLYQALLEYAASVPLRGHMPGHKGKPLPAPELAGLAALDVTELPATGNLYEDLPPIQEAQALWAPHFGVDSVQFLTGGSTMGIFTAFTVCCAPGDRVLIDRGCHRSVYHALALLDLDPVFLPRPWRMEDGVIGPFFPKDVEKYLDQNPDIKTICITSPTYSGVLSNVPTLARMIHTRCGKLIIDGAHGAHLPFLGVDAFGGADAVVVSAHKTLPAMGQTALLLTRGIPAERVRRAAAVYGTSSPSYPMLASLDLARDWMERTGTVEYKRVVRRTQALRQRFPCLGSGESGLVLDPTRLTLHVHSGPQAARRLEAMGVYPEMEDGGHVVFILTGCDSDADLDRLERALSMLGDEVGHSAPLPPPPLPQRVLSPRSAMFAASELIDLEQAQGRICASQLAPYPPGVPVVAPGEVLGKKELAYLREIGYNNREVSVISESLGKHVPPKP